MRPPSTLTLQAAGPQQSVLHAVFHIRVVLGPGPIRSVSLLLHVSHTVHMQLMAVLSEALLIT